ncbi:hypothetical protein DFH27DRAFT_541793 [Peziza echinospora]|nr:hypothetical protein DFH27DRAFT_541793 [Peziza echinospora]
MSSSGRPCLVARGACCLPAGLPRLAGCRSLPCGRLLRAALRLCGHAHASGAAAAMCVCSGRAAGSWAARGQPEASSQMKLSRGEYRGRSLVPRARAQSEAARLASAAIPLAAHIPRPESPASAPHARHRQRRSAAHKATLPCAPSHSPTHPPIRCRNSPTLSLTHALTAAPKRHTALSAISGHLHSPTPQTLTHAHKTPRYHPNTLTAAHADPSTHYPPTLVRHPHCRCPPTHPHTH